jgi:hypothetical protein
MRSLTSVSLGLLTMLAIALTLAGTAAAAPKPLTFYEQNGDGSLMPEAAFSLYTFSGITITTSDGSVECPSESSPSIEAGQLIGSLVSNEQFEDEVTINNSRGDTGCASTIGLGTAQLVPRGQPWSLVLSGTGKVQLKSGGGVSEVAFPLEFSGGAFCWYYSATKLAGRVAVDPGGVRTSVSFYRQPLRLAPTLSSRICPRSARLSVDYFAFGEGGEPIYDSNA